MQSKIDKRLIPEQEALLKSLIEKKIEKIRHDRFDFSNVSFQRVTFFCEGQAYELNNSVEELEFMWDEFGYETVEVFKFFKAEDRGIDYNYGWEGILPKSKHRLTKRFWTSRSLTTMSKDSASPAAPSSANAITSRPLSSSSKTSSIASPAALGSPMTSKSTKGQIQR
ncbi:MAG: hypothetical protein SPI58_01940 [Candidatus Enteromonas sp.]|nr:hypothetical protein [Candidatus Enteromonas sp.]